MVDARTEHNVALEEVEQEMGETGLNMLKLMSSEPDIYKTLARSIAPNVYGLSLIHISEPTRPY